MKTHVQKWGNSMAVRIPQAFAEELGLHMGSAVELQLHQQQLVLSPLPPEETLEDLLAAITPENRHGEIPTGQPQGREIW